MTLLRKMAARVARRHFRRLAGIIEAPPRVVEALEEFMVPVYASHVLAQTEEKLAEWHSFAARMKAKLAEIERAEAKWKREGEDILTRLKPGKVFRVYWPAPTPGRENGYYAIGVKRGKVRAYSGWRESWVTAHASVDSEAEAKRTSLKPRLQGAWEHSIYQTTDEILHTMQESAEEIRRTLQDMRTGQLERRDEKLVDLLLVKRECLKHTKRARFYKTRAKKEIEIDTTGWRYDAEIPKDLRALQREFVRIDKHNKRVIRQLLAEAKTLPERGQSSTKPYEVLSALKNVGEGHTTSKRKLEIRYEGERWRLLVDGYGHHYRNLSDIEEGAQRMWTGKPRDTGFGFTHFDAYLDFKGHLDRGGLWNRTRLHMEVDVGYGGPKKPIKTVEDFKEGLFKIKRTIRHEAQHVAQDLLEEIRMGRNRARFGLPPTEIRTPGALPGGRIQDPEAAKPFGREEKGGWKGHILHHHRDVEFFTNLSDDIDRIEKALRKVPKPYWNEWVRATLGLVDSVPLGNEMSARYEPQRGLYGTWPSRVPQPSDIGWRFKRFKDRNVGKWRRAVKEVYVELSKRGYNLQGGYRPWYSQMPPRKAQQIWNDHDFLPEGLIHSWSVGGPYGGARMRWTPEGWLHGPVQRIFYNVSEQPNGVYYLRWYGGRNTAPTRVVPEKMPSRLKPERRRPIEKMKPEAIRKLPPGWSEENPGEDWYVDGYYFLITPQGEVKSAKEP